MGSNVGEIYQKILEVLPKEPKGYDTSERSELWTDGDLILCPSESDIETVEDFLELLFNRNVAILSGYYDPFEDAENGEQDDCTGFYYVAIE